jgi:hypothetical protein
VAIRLGLADHEIIGLAIGLAQAVYGESAVDERAAWHADDTPTPQEPASTLAVRREVLFEE